MISRVVSWFWFAFLADGILSLSDEILVAAIGASPLGVSRNVLAVAVILFSLLMAGFVALSPRAPKRILAPLAFYALWTGPAAAFPFGLQDIHQLGLILAAVQIVLALLVIIPFRARPAGVFAANSGPPFSWKHLVVAGPATTVLLAILGALSLFSSASFGLESYSGGYVKVRSDGLYLIERRFRSGDREVRLAGMIHVADREFYSKILPENDASRKSVVLVEGVTDEKGLLGHRALNYGRVAKLLNLAAQTDSVFTEEIRAGLETGGVKRSRGMLFKHADVDVSTFHPKTVALLVAVGDVLQKASVMEMLRALADPRSPLGEEAAHEQAMHDILDARNAHLAAEIAASLPEFDQIIIPWGALHLWEIEQWLLDRGFTFEEELARKAVAFW